MDILLIYQPWWKGGYLEITSCCNRNKSFSINKDMTLSLTQKASSRGKDCSDHSPTDMRLLLSLAPPFKLKPN